jgi:branched-chain amino acid transport system permease protein
MEDARTVGAVDGHAAAVRRAQVRRQVRRALTRGLIALVIFVCVGRLVQQAILDKAQFLSVTMNGITFAGLLFVVASGFTLAFGLMRVVNMAHGSLYLLGGYLAFEIQDQGDVFTGGEPKHSWWLSALAASLIIGIVGLLIQQLLLRWNQGETLQQALITIAVSVVATDQMLANFGGLPEAIKKPPAMEGAFDLHLFGVSYPKDRMYMLFFAIIIGILLFAWVHRTRMGMIVRAGVDDRAMVSALGINIERVFAISFFVGALLAGFGGTLGGTTLSLAPGQDGTFLVWSLVVVIVGGMGSLGGAAVGALLLGLVYNYSAVYLPQAYTNYSILLVFGLLVIVLAVRPLGLFGRPA